MSWIHLCSENSHKETCKSFDPLCHQHRRYHSILMPCVLICGQYCGICWMLRCCRIGRQKCISTILSVWSSGAKPIDFFLRSVALLYRTISDKRMWKISLMFIFFSLFRVVKLLLKEDSNMLTKELSFYIQDDDWLRWFSTFTFLSVDKSTLIIKSEKEICWDVIKSASFCMTCKSYLFLGWKTHFFLWIFFFKYSWFFYSFTSIW